MTVPLVGTGHIPFLLFSSPSVFTVSPLAEGMELTDGRFVIFQRFQLFRIGKSCMWPFYSPNLHLITSFRWHKRGKGRGQGLRGRLEQVLLEAKGVEQDGEFHMSHRGASR